MKKTIILWWCQCFKMGLIWSQFSQIRVFSTFFQWTWYLILSKLFILYFWKTQFFRLSRPFRWLGLKFCTSHIIDIYIVDNKRRLGLPKKFLNGKLNFRFTVSFSIFFLCTNKKNCAWVDLKNICSISPPFKYPSYTLHRLLS